MTPLILFVLFVHNSCNTTQRQVQYRNSTLTHRNCEISHKPTTKEVHLNFTVQILRNDNKGFLSSWQTHTVTLPCSGKFPLQHRDYLHRNIEIPVFENHKLSLLPPFLLFNLSVVPPSSCSIVYLHAVPCKSNIYTLWSSV